MKFDGVENYMEARLHTAVAFIIFKRPEQTARVFQAISEAKPARLYIIADGARNSDEALLCEQTRQIVENVDWDCEVRKNYSDLNLGVRNRIISGLDWVFEQEDRAIILEDDCLPDPTFFRFCDELLNYYKDDGRVMHISGDSFYQEKQVSAESYYFSRYAHIWGWATWRRAWVMFHRWDNDFSNLKMNFEVFPTSSERKFWKNLLDQLQSGQLHYTWDYQWTIICLATNALCIMPTRNLVSNIGFDANATHTVGHRWYANLPTFSMSFPLIHPRNQTWDSRADEYSARVFFNAKPPRWVRVIKTIIGSR